MTLNLLSIIFIIGSFIFIIINIWAIVCILIIGRRAGTGTAMKHILYLAIVDIMYLAWASYWCECHHMF